MKFVYWDPEKGYGFIRLLDGRRVFVHASKVYPPCPRGVDLMKYEVDEKTLKLEKTEKGWQAQLVSLIPSWKNEDDSVRSSIVWPGCAETSCKEYIIIKKDNCWWESKDFPLFYDETAAEAAMVAGCPIQFLEEKKIRLEELRREYILFKKGGVPDDRGIEMSPEEWVSQNGPYRFGIRITPHGEKINFPDIASARKWMKEVRTQEGEPDAEFICTGGPIEGYPVSGIYTVYWYIWVFRPGCWKMIHGYLFPIPEGQVMKERGRQQEFIYDSARSYGGNSFAEACDPDSMDYMF